MNGFNVYKKIKGANRAKDLYLYLLGNPKRTVYDLFLNTPTDKYNKEMYLQAQKLFSLREGIFKKLTNKGIINNDFDQSSIVEQKYKKEYKESIAKKTKLEPEFMESIAERNILRKQRLNEIANKEKTINNNLFKEHFEYSSPSNIYKYLNTATDIEESKTKVNKMKNNLADFMIKFENVPTNNTKKIRGRNNMVEIVKHILKFNQLEQEGRGLKILTPNQMHSRLPISLTKLKAGNSSEKLKNKLGKFCILCTEQKNLQKMFIKVWLTSFKHGNNLFKL